MGSYTKTIIIAIGFSLLLLVGIVMLPRLLNRTSVGPSSQGGQPSQPGDVAEVSEPNTTVEIGTKEVSKGIFDKVEGGSIFYLDGATINQLPLTVDEVVLACTTQNLDNAKVLDYNQVTNIDVYNPTTIVGKVPQGEPVVVFAADVNGVFRAHTIAMAASSCAK